MRYLRRFFKKRYLDGQESNEFALGDAKFEIYHDIGEIDDSLWLYLPDHKLIYSGDFIISLYPYVGNLYKVQHYPKGSNDNDVLVGPLARHILTNLDKFEKINNFLGGFNTFWKKNLLFSSFLGLLEIYSEVIRCIESLNDPCFNTKRPLPSFDSIKHLEASSAVEAPRGLLLHHYEVSKRSKIKCLKLFTATEFNLPLMNKMITKYARNLYEVKGDINLVKKMVQLIIRAFDPCVSYATH